MIILLTSNLFAQEEFFIKADMDSIEINQKTHISLRVIGGDYFPQISWSCSSGKILLTSVQGEIKFIAPNQAGIIKIDANIKLGDDQFNEIININVLKEGSLKKTADVLMVVDTNTLKNVWVDESHPSESFTPPLKIKGTFRMDTKSGKAFVGGSWPSYLMYDDGTHGDKIAGDGLWSLLMQFERADAGVYVAFDDSSTYRVEYESGLAWRMKMAFIELDEYEDEHSNVKFVPDSDKEIFWSQEMADKGGIYGKK